MVAGAHSNHTLNGVTIMNSGTPVDLPALTVEGGTVSGVTLLDGQWYGGVDATGSDHAASWLSRSAGGFTLVGNGGKMIDERVRADAKLSGHSDHALLGGVAGEANARWSLDADGVRQFGDGGDAGFDTRLGRPRAQVIAWDPPPMEARGGSCSLNVTLDKAAVGDIVAVSHEGMGPGQLVLLSAHVGAAGVVTVVAMNAAAEAVDLPNATLRLMLSPVDTIKTDDVANLGTAGPAISVSVDASHALFEVSPHGEAGLMEDIGCAVGYQPGDLGTSRSGCPFGKGWFHKRLSALGAGGGNSMRFGGGAQVRCPPSRVSGRSLWRASLTACFSRAVQACIVYNATGKLAAKPMSAHVVRKYCEERGVTVLDAAFWDAVLDEMTAANLTLVFGVNFVRQPRAMSLASL